MPKQKIVAFKKWKKMWEVAEAPIFEMSHGTVLVIDKQKALTGLVDYELILYGKRGFLAAYSSRESLNKAAESGFKKFLSNKWLKKFFKEARNAIRGSYVVLERLKREQKEKKWRKLSNLEMASLLQLVSDIHRGVFAYFNATNPQFIAKLEEKLRIDLNSGGISRSKIKKILPRLTVSTKLTTLHKERLDWLKIVKKVKKKTPMIKRSLISPTYFEKLQPEVFRELKKHQEKYELIAGAEGNKPWDLRHFIKMLKEDLSKELDVEKEIGNIVRRPLELKKEKEQIVKKYKISRNTCLLVSILGEVAHIRLELRLSWTALFHLLRDIVREASRRLECSYEELVAYSADEIVEFLRGKRTISRKEAKERNEEYLYLIKNRTVEFFSGKEAGEKKLSLIPERDYSKIIEMKGTIAYPGKVKGRVYIFHWGAKEFKKKIYNMPKDAILVAGQTRPILMPAIYKAKAIVTDEGGITCHAAIVSRELKIPCVIATEIATKVLQDGDLVEVDAEKGIVRKLNERD